MSNALRPATRPDVTSGIKLKHSLITNLSLTHSGLVLFNEGAHVAHPVVPLSSRQNRHGVMVHVKNKFNLTPKDGSCVRCGVMKALEVVNKQL